MSDEQLVPDEPTEGLQEAPESSEDQHTIDPVDDGLVAYTVLGRQAVDEVKRGGTLRLDPNEPRTARLLGRGQIVRADTQEE